jgi:hypothetical protein
MSFYEEQVITCVLWTSGLLAWQALEAAGKTNMPAIPRREEGLILYSLHKNHKASG